MTLTEINIEEVKASVDTTLEALQKGLRDLNHQVISGFFSINSIKAKLGCSILDLVKPRTCLRRAPGS